MLSLFCIIYINIKYNSIVSLFCKPFLIYLFVFQESALDLSQVVMDKMDFLEIDVSKQSKLEVLYVQLKVKMINSYKLF